MNDDTWTPIPGYTHPNQQERSVDDIIAEHEEALDAFKHHAMNVLAVLSLVLLVGVFVVVFCGLVGG